jgi:hypothetical protein
MLATAINAPLSSPVSTGFKPVPDSELMLLRTELRNPNPYEFKLKPKRKRHDSR